MLCIVAGNGSKAKATEWVTWHVGERAPIMNARVITFQADGDELEVIVRAIKLFSRPESNVITLSNPPEEGGEGAA